MRIDGFDKLARHVTELNSPGGSAKIAAYFISVFTLTTIYFILTDQIPTWTLDSQIVVMALGYLILSRFFTQKKKLIEKHGENAYRHAFGKYALPGLAIIFASLAHIAYMNGPKFTQPLIAAIFNWAGWIFIIIGAILAARSVYTFGLDNVTMVYVYHPEQGQIVRTSIYSIIRHPVYGGVLRLAIGMALLNGGIYPITFILILPLLVFGWLRLVEEKELIERVPEYAEYRKRVPAFFPYPDQLSVFFRFLITGK